MSTLTHSRPLALDLSLFAQAQSFYSARNYENVAVPWIVGEEAYNVTFPKDAGVQKFSTLGGFLVGSAEHSFIQMLIDGEQLGRVQATTPCFRDEEYDEIHMPYFFKLELFDNTLPPNEAGVFSLMEDALEFFTQFIPVKIVREGDLAWDLVSEQGLEIGSYGVRSYGEHQWIYGTGLAVPRFQRALAEVSTV